MRFDVYIKPRERHKCSLPVFGYVYRVKDRLLNMSYIGVRYAEGIDINSDLGVKYFSSSKTLLKQLHASKKPLQRFYFEIRKIFNYVVNNVLLDNHNSDIIGLYTEQRNSLKNKLLSYEASLLEKLKAGNNPRLYNLVARYTKQHGEIAYG